ncbi:MAG TPA: hypothetical protein VKM55_30735 [Candidatus Lokiarchaeia archaeon]|nr:hypothetical protein [Candidatus Lokiarchaeia archaeon]
MIWDIMEITLWYSVTLICGVLFVVFILQNKKREKISRPFFLGFSIFLFGYGIARLCENIRRYSIGSYNDVINAWTTVPRTQIAGNDLLLRILYYLIAWIAIAILYFNIEKYIFKKTRYILTICSLGEGALAISIYIYFSLISYWALVVNFFFVGYFIPILFLNLTREFGNNSAIKKGCVTIALGMLFFVTGVMVDLPESAYFFILLGQQSPELMIRIISPILVLSGLLVLSLGFRSFFPKLSKNREEPAIKVENSPTFSANVETKRGVGKFQTSSQKKTRLLGMLKTTEKFDLIEASKDLGMPVKEIKNVILELAAKGKINGKFVAANTFQVDRI